jgi:molecular chaperone HscB
MKRAVVGVANHSTFNLMCTCNAPLQNVAFCSQCGALKLIELTCPFQVFGLPKEFSIDLSNLDDTYLRLQNKLHPDRFSHSAEAKRLAQNYSGYLNWAYHILKNPLKRSEILLEGGVFSASQEELIEQMKKREYLEEIFSEEALQEFEKSIREEKNNTEREMESLFKEGNKEGASQCFGRLKYLHRLISEIELKKERL